MMYTNFCFTILDSVDSTNNYAMAKVHAGMAKHGDAYFTHLQTNGKGQRGNVWQSGNGQNLALSMVIEPKKLKISQQFLLSATVALGCFKFFSKYAGVETSIKWPNDIYWRDRKAGGILIENVISKNSVWKYAVVGIGININQTNFSTLIPNAVSLHQITGKPYDTVLLAKELHENIFVQWDAAVATSLEKIMLQYNNYLYKKNTMVLLKKEGILFETLIKEVLPNGQLITTDVVDNQFNFGEVEWLINK